MEPRNNFCLMAGFNAWVNGRVYDSVALLADDAYRLDRKAFFGSIHNTLNHLLVVDRLWIGRIRGVAAEIRSLEQILHDDFESLRNARIEEDRQFAGLIEGLSDAALHAPVVYRRILGDGEQATRCDRILLTLFNHQTHHRGQVHAMLTQDGIVTAPLDLVYYLEELGLS